MGRLDLSYQMIMIIIVIMITTTTTTTTKIMIIIKKGLIHGFTPTSKRSSYP